MIVDDGGVTLRPDNGRHSGRAQREPESIAPVPMTSMLQVMDSGFAVSRGAGMTRNLLGRNASELIVQAAAHDVAGEGCGDRIAARTGCVAGRLAEIDKRIEICDLGRPVIDEGILDASARGPAGLGLFEIARAQ